VLLGSYSNTNLFCSSTATSNNDTPNLIHSHSPSLTNDGDSIGLVNETFEPISIGPILSFDEHHEMLTQTKNSTDTIISLKIELERQKLNKTIDAIYSELSGDALKEASTKLLKTADKLLNDCKNAPKKTMYYFAFNCAKKAQISCQSKKTVYFKPEKRP
jgi:hypothetical protein